MLVNQLDSAIDTCVTDLLAGEPEALAATKQLLTRVPAMSVEDALAWTAELSSLIFRSDEAREGIPKFLKKRPPSRID